MSEWIEKPLGEVTSYLAKGIPPKYTEDFTENAIYVLNQKCNREFVISYDAAKLHDLTQKKVAEEKMLQPGDVLINSTGEGTAGRVAQIWDLPYPTTTDGHMILMRPTFEIDPLYYGYAVKAYQSQIETLAEGSTGQTEINKKRLLDEIIIRFPKDKDEQHSIAEVLENIDNKIEVNNKINRNLAEQQKNIVLNFLQAKEMPIKLLSEISTIKYGKGLPKNELKIDGYPVFGGNGIIGYFNKFMYEEPQILISCRGAASGNILESLPYSFVTSNSLVVELDNYIYFEFLKQYLNMNQLHGYATGSAQPQITIDNIKGVEVPYPDIDQIIELSKGLQSLSKYKLLVVKENKNLTQIRDSILPKLMSGELDVSEFDI